MKNKDKLKQILAQAKSFNEAKKADEEKKLAEEKSLAQALNQVNNKQTNKEKTMKQLSKQAKSDLAMIKMWVVGKAHEQRTSVDEGEFSKMVSEYAEAKAIEMTTDHATLLRQTQMSEVIFSFDEKSEAGSILALFKQYQGDVPVNSTITLPVDDQNAILQNVSQTGAIVEQTFDFTPFTLSTSRSAMGFKLSRSVQFKSIVDLIKYVQDTMTNAISKGLVEGILNGQGASAGQQDSGYSSTTSLMGNKKLADGTTAMPGIRAKLAAAGYTCDAVNKDFDSTDGRALLQKMFDAAGAKFSRSQAPYVILVNRLQKLKISALKNGAGVSGINTSAASAVYDNSYQGVPVIECAWLKSNTATSGTGLSETGFVSSTAADNDHSSALLIDPSSVWYAIGGERVDVDYVSSTDTYNVNMNCQCGWNILVDARNQPGVLLVNIGADIA